MEKFSKSSWTNENLDYPPVVEHDFSTFGTYVIYLVHPRGLERFPGSQYLLKAALSTNLGHTNEAESFHQHAPP